MSFDPIKSDLSAAQAKQGLEPQPGDADVVNALVEIEHATRQSSQFDQASEKDQPLNAANAPVLPESSGVAKALVAQRSKIIILYCIVIFIVLNMMRLEYLKKGTFVHSSRTPAPRRAVDSAAQNEIEGLLSRVAAGDHEAASDVLERSSSWIGRTERSTSTSRSIDISMNLPDLRQREAAIEAAIVLDGVAKSEAGIQRLEAQLPTPVGRPWALWMLGALGNRGIDPVHTAKIIGAYIDNPDANTRAAAVNGLAVLGTDETIPMLLDRFRNDPSPVVQERAACGLAESGMYTHEQRMVAAATLVSWLDDSLLSPQQHIWTIQALADISHQNFGNDSAAWRNWYESARVAG